MTSWKGMSSGLTSLWGCSCLNASKYAATRRGAWMLWLGKLEKGSPVPSCHKCCSPSHRHHRHHHLGADTARQ